MIDEKLLSILCCPTDHTPLMRADDRLAARINRAIAAGRIKNRSGRAVQQLIDGGLIRADNTLLYPILDGIPVLMAEEAIELVQLE